MTDKELRRLSRSELIDIIYELKVENEELYKEKSEKTIAMEEAGSIAEAALGINRVFEAAQAAADQYVSSIIAMQKELRTRVSETEKECERILARTEEECSASVERTNRAIDRKWEEFVIKARKYLKEHSDTEENSGDKTGNLG